MISECIRPGPYGVMGGLHAYRCLMDMDVLIGLGFSVYDKGGSD